MMTLAYIWKGKGVHWPFWNEVNIIQKNVLKVKEALGTQVSQNGIISKASVEFNVIGIPVERLVCVCGGMSLSMCKNWEN